MGFFHTFPQAAQGGKHGSAPPHLSVVQLGLKTQSGCHSGARIWPPQSWSCTLPAATVLDLCRQPHFASFLPPPTSFQVFLPGFLSSNLYYKYLNDLIHSVRGDEFASGGIAPTAHGPSSTPDSDSHSSSTDGTASSQVRGHWLGLVAQGGSGSLGLMGSSFRAAPSSSSSTTVSCFGLRSCCWKTLVGKDKVGGGEARRLWIKKG